MKQTTQAASVLLLLAVLATWGCNPKQPKPFTPSNAPKPIESTPAVVATEPATLAPPSPPALQLNTSDQAPAAASDEMKPEHKAMLEGLTVAFREYRSTYMTDPLTPEDLVKAGLIPTLPKPPGGKKYVIDRVNMRITLTNIN